VYIYRIAQSQLYERTCELIYSVSQKTRHQLHFQTSRLCSESANLRQGVYPQRNVIWDSNPDFTD